MKAWTCTGGSKTVALICINDQTNTLEQKKNFMGEIMNLREGVWHVGLTVSNYNADSTSG